MTQLNQLVGRLINARVEFVVIGGFAAMAHGVTLVTHDVDVCCRFDPTNLTRLHGAVQDLHPVHRMTPQRLPFVLTLELCATLKNLYLETDFGPIDCLSTVPGIGDFDAARNRSVEIDFRGGKCLVLSIDALIDAKATTSRTHDRRTILQLKAIKERKGS